MASRKITLSCSLCHAPFFQFPSRKIKGNIVFCSWNCRAKSATDLRIITLRCYEKIQFCSHGVDCRACCWLWLGKKDVYGYGKLSVVYEEEKSKRHYVLVHRFMWFLKYGRYPEPEGCHNCPTGDNPSCVNPWHIFEGTQRMNVLDAMQKGRMASGDRNGSRTHPEKRQRGSTHYASILNEETIRTIRRLAQEGWRQKDLAQRFALKTKHVWKIVHYQIWADVL